MIPSTDSAYALLFQGVLEGKAGVCVPCLRLTPDGFKPGVFTCHMPISKRSSALSGRQRQRGIHAIAMAMHAHGELPNYGLVER